MLFRKLTKYIEDYYATSNRALLLTGARQTGKTFAAREFGRKFKNFIEINFIERQEAVNLFQGVTDSDEILLRLSALVNENIEEGETLIFFDEVQCCENIITAIKFLVDDGRYKFILSGSLLGVELKDIRSVPVGYMGVKEVFPLTVEEFMINLGVSGNVMSRLRHNYIHKEEVDSIINERMLQLFRLYTVIGGMPAAVQTYLDTKNLQAVMTVQKDIVTLYRKDISQYADKDKLKIKEIFDLIPSELNEKNKRFILKNLNQHAKFERYKYDFLWLKDAGVAIPVYNVEEPKEPLLLSITRNLFKLFCNDVGLLAAQYADGIQARILANDRSINYGAVYENVVAQELVAHEIKPLYYNNKRRGEVDFVISISGKVMPIEVKSGKDYTRHNALSNILNAPEFDIEEGVVLGNCNIKREGKVLYLPIYMVMFIDRPDITEVIYQVDMGPLL
ncbi:MAG: ATP-binding protein [Muribaculaceae bacterium]|nr:ATP-binding protein [Muribaculaceae bacterium]